MTAFLLGGIAAIVILLIVVAIVTRGFIFTAIWFMILVGINKLLGRNTFS